MTKQLAMSHTALDTFQTCPRQYQAKYVTKEVKFMETDATRYGNRMHTAFENRLKEGLPLSDEFKDLEPMALKILDMKGTLMVERPLAVREDMSPTTFFASDVALRGKGDALVFRDDTGMLYVFDWKTGKPKVEKQQLEIMGIIAFYNIPNVKRIKVAFVYTKTGTIDTAEYTAAQIPEMLAGINYEISRVKKAHETGIFLPTPNGLCKAWCQVESCPFYKKGRYS